MLRGPDKWHPFPFPFDWATNIHFVGASARGLREDARRQPILLWRWSAWIPPATSTENIRRWRGCHAYLYRSVGYAYGLSHSLACGCTMDVACGIYALSRRGTVGWHRPSPESPQPDAIGIGLFVTNAMWMGKLSFVGTSKLFPIMAKVTPDIRHRWQFCGMTRARSEEKSCILGHLGVYIQDGSMEER